MTSETKLTNGKNIESFLISLHSGTNVTVLVSITFRDQNDNLLKKIDNRLLNFINRLNVTSINFLFRKIYAIDINVD